MKNIKDILSVKDTLTIDSFRGKYFFLSNFFMKPIYFESLWYRSSEHAFQTQKATNEKDKQYMLNAQEAWQAKQRGNEIPCRADWDSNKMVVMYDILRCKFTDDILAKKLIATDDALLIEGNWWDDRYWGMTRDFTGKWKGENFLGQLLMKVRNEIR